MTSTSIEDDPNGLQAALHRQFAGWQIGGAAVISVTERTLFDRQGVMKAIVQEGYGSADVLKLREIPLPTVADDGVLVRVHAASVNALDAHIVHMPLVARAFFGLPRPRVAVRGVDVAGTVESVGKNVTAFKHGAEARGARP